MGLGLGDVVAVLAPGKKPPRPPLHILDHSLPRNLTWFSCSRTALKRKVFLSDIQRKEKKSKSVGMEKLCQGARVGTPWYKKSIGIETLG